MSSCTIPPNLNEKTFFYFKFEPNSRIEEYIQVQSNSIKLKPTDYTFQEETQQYLSRYGRCSYNEVMKLIPSIAGHSVVRDDDGKVTSLEVLSRADNSSLLSTKQQIINTCFKYYFNDK